MHFACLWGIPVLITRRTLSSDYEACLEQSNGVPACAAADFRLYNVLSDKTTLFFNRNGLGLSTSPIWLGTKAPKCNISCVFFTQPQLGPSPVRKVTPYPSQVQTQSRPQAITRMDLCRYIIFKGFTAITGNLLDSDRPGGLLLGSCGYKSPKFIPTEMRTQRSVCFQIALMSKIPPKLLSLI